jgi:hypothetical protein
VLFANALVTDRHSAKRRRRDEGRLSIVKREREREGRGREGEGEEGEGEGGEGVNREREGEEERGKEKEHWLNETLRA